MVDGAEVDAVGDSAESDSLACDAGVGGGVGVGVGECAVVVVGGGVFVVSGLCAPGFFEVVDGLVVGVPCCGGVLLVGAGGVVVVHVDGGVGCGGELGGVDPGDEGAGGAVVFFDFVVEFCSCFGGEGDVVAVGLCVADEIWCDDVDEDWESGEVFTYFIMINGYLFPILPVIIPPRV